MPNIEALQQLRRVVENAPEDLLHMRRVVDPSPCGTARCALGWCLVDPWFQKNTELRNYAAWADDTFPPANLEAIFGAEPEEIDHVFAGSINTYADGHAVSKAEVLWNIDRLMAGEETRPYAATDPDDAKDYPEAYVPHE